MSTTFRTDTKARLVTVLEAFKTAHPEMLLRVHRARPSSFPDLPAVYIDAISEDVKHDSQTRNRTLTGLAFVLVDAISDNTETALRLDQTVDALIEHLSAYPQLGGTAGVWSSLRVADEDAPFGDYDFVGVRFSFPDISFMDGRP